MKTCKIIIIGGSAGSLEVSFQVYYHASPTLILPSLLYCIAKPEQTSIVDNLLSTQNKLTVKEIEEKDNILPGVIYLVRQIIMC